MTVVVQADMGEGGVPIEVRMVLRAGGREGEGGFGLMDGLSELAQP